MQLNKTTAIAKVFCILILSVFLMGFKNSTTPPEEIGKASYYSSKFEGRKTSSGEIFTQKNLTAAHKSLPFGTMVKVTNIGNDSTVVVKINDRLSKSSGHTIDLTVTAAKQLNFIQQGSAKVKIEKIN